MSSSVIEFVLNGIAEEQDMDEKFRKNIIISILFWLNDMKDKWQSADFCAL